MSYLVRLESGERTFKGPGGCSVQPVWNSAMAIRVPLVSSPLPAWEAYFNSIGQKATRRGPGLLVIKMFRVTVCMLHLGLGGRGEENSVGRWLEVPYKSNRALENQLTIA